MGARVMGALVALSIVLLACGCASEPDSEPARDVPATPAASAATPTAACPAIEGVDLPPECAPYDPDAAMAENDRYREREPLEDDAVAAGRDLIPGVVVALDGVRSRGAVTPEAVIVALEQEGLSGVQTRADGERLLFGAMAPGGGCVYGEIRKQSVQVEVGGLILDGGCLPAQ